MPETGGYQVVIDPAEWYRFKKDLDKFDPAITRALRKRIRNAGDTAAEKVREELEKSSPAGGPDSGAGRAALIAATKVSISFGKRSAGTRIVTSSSKLPAEHKGLLNVYNKTSVRHPVWGNKRVWVNQEGRPYFGKVIEKALNKEIVDEIRGALDDAMAAIGATHL